MEQKIKSLEDVKAPDKGSSIIFKQSKALELHNPYPIIATDICKSFDKKVLFDNASFTILFTSHDRSSLATFF